jgi:hypothetical protein
MSTGSSDEKKRQIWRFQTSRDVLRMSCKDGDAMVSARSIVEEDGCTCYLWALHERLCMFVRVQDASPSVKIGARTIRTRK